MFLNLAGGGSMWVDPATDANSKIQALPFIRRQRANRNATPRRHHPRNLLPPLKSRTFYFAVRWFLV